MHLDDLTIYKEILFATKKQKYEAEQIMPLLFGLSLCMENLVNVTYYTPDPPDFTFHLKSGETVGVELTQLIRNSKQGKGDKQLKVEFPEWEKEIKSKVGTTEAEFEFSKQSLRDMFEQLNRQLEEKACKCRPKKVDYSDMWLAFHIPLSNPMGVLVRNQRWIEKLGNVFSRLWGKFLYDTDIVFRKQNVFSTLVFFSSDSHFALSKDTSLYRGVGLNKELVAIGKNILDDEYDSLTVRTVRQMKHSKWVKDKSEK